MKRRKNVSRDEVLREMMDLATRPTNDAVRLAYLPAEREEEILGLDLLGLTEFKRNGNGTVELKLTNRLAVLEKLADLVQDSQSAAAAFFQAMDGPGEERDVSRR